MLSDQGTGHPGNTLAEPLLLGIFVVSFMPLLIDREPGGLKRQFHNLRSTCIAMISSYLTSGTRATSSPLAARSSMAMIKTGV